MKNFVNDSDGLSIADLEKIILSIIAIGISTVICYKYVASNYVDVLMTQLDMFVMGAMVARKAFKYNALTKQMALNTEGNENLGTVDNFQVGNIEDSENP